MQSFSRDFYQNYANLGSIDLLGNPGGRSSLIPFLFRTLLHIVTRARTYDVIHLGDAALALLIPLIRRCSQAKVSVTAHGLDIIYPRRCYQSLISALLPTADRVIAVSRFTRDQCAARGVPASHLVIIPNGVDFRASAPSRRARVQPVSAREHILLSVGRLIPRKGYAWFVANVLPLLPSSYTYIVAGVGSEAGTIRNAAAELGVTSRLSLLGAVSQEEKIRLFQSADLLVMPNVHVEGDQEGFGIVALEAGRYGLPIIATDIEGLRDAVIQNRTGQLVPPGDAAAFARAILRSRFNRGMIPQVVASKFSWRRIARRYHQQFLSITISTTSRVRSARQHA
jgi:glycosyltransferase involved in cell wall biosynthesis